MGRQDDVAQVGDLLVRSRLVTLTGVGGMGKTRLALEVAGRVAPRYADGAWFVELGSVFDGSTLPQTVAEAFSRRDSRTAIASVDDLVHQIGARRALLVLDNCEHLLEACALLTQEILRGCPAVTILATSRERLAIVGEHTWMVRPLSLPESEPVDARSLKTSEAGQLFLDRATATNPGFRVSDESATTVARICHRLDGMPLAIELAAMRATSLSPSETLERLDDRFRLLTGGGPSLPDRHQTLSAALEWSHDLLTPAEAAFLRRISVFSGWTLAAAEDVCAGPPVARAEIVDYTAALVGKSLVIADSGDEEVRYSLLETIRSWAGAKLDASGESAAVRKAHATWCVALAEKADEELGGRRPRPWVERLEAEHDNLRAALDWARAAGEVEIALRLITALARFWRMRGYLDEGQRWLEWGIVASAESPAPLQAKALRAAGLLRGLLGDFVSALPLLEESSSLYADTGDHDASVCVCNPMFLMFRNPRHALPLLEDRVAICQRNGDTTGLAHLFHSIGQVHYILGGTEEASRNFEQCLQLGRGAAHSETLRFGLLGMTRVDLLRGDLVRAEAWAAEARALAEDADEPDDVATALGFLGEIARVRGQWDRAQAVLEECMKEARRAGMPLSVARAYYFLARLAEARRDPQAGELFDKALSVADAGEAPVFHDVRCRLGLAAAAEAAGDLVAAGDLLVEALESAQVIGDMVATAEALHGLSVVARRQDRDEEAAVLTHRSLDLYHQVGALPEIASMLEATAGLAVEVRPEVAVRLLGSAQAIRDSQGYARSVRQQQQYELDVQAIRAAVSAEAFESGWPEGLALSPDDAVAYALRGRRSRDRPASGWDSLTPAEREVVRLVRDGLSNREVGERLFISPRTVGHHLTHVFDKLGIRSRGALINEMAGREI